MVQIRVSPYNFLSCHQNNWVVTQKNVSGSGGIRTHASEETGALNQRLRPLGHATVMSISCWESIIARDICSGLVCITLFAFIQCLRPYHVESTSSRPITEVETSQLI